MESGTPGVRNDAGRLDESHARRDCPGSHGPTEALSLGPTVPRILSRQGAGREYRAKARRQTGRCRWTGR